MFRSGKPSTSKAKRERLTEAEKDKLYKKYKSGGFTYDQLANEFGLSSKSSVDLSCLANCYLSWLICVKVQIRGYFN